MLQQGGLGGPYATISTQALVRTALNNNGSIGIGAGVPADAILGHVFTATNHVLPINASMAWNCYFGSENDFQNWGNGPSGTLTFHQGGWEFDIGAAVGADQPSAFSSAMTLDLAGNLTLPLGTLTVARDPSTLMDVATLNWVGNNTVASFNNRIGQVQLNAADVYNALQLCDPIATQPWVQSAIQAGIQNLLWTCPFVDRWNGRSGSVYLTLSDITCVFYQPGQQPISPTPPLTSNDDSIATTKWATEFIENELAGAGGTIATQTWVLANTVNSFNGRMGPVTLTTADVIDVGAAPLNSPNFSGLPTAPTAAQGQATGQIATTAFVQQAIAHNTAGVSTFNTRAGDVTLTTADVTTAGGLTNPSANLTGAPTAPTAAPGTSSPQIANTQFVMAALANTVTSFNTRSGAITLTTADITGAGGAPIVSPNFSSVPTAPTAAPGTNTVQLATCAFVTAALNTAGGVSSFNGRTGAVDLIGNDISAAGGLVNPSVTLTGTPTAPTATAGTNSQQIATTAFVATALSAGTVTSFNTRTGAITLTGADIQTAGGALLAGPAFTGVPTAPTAPANTNTTQLATTQFVMAAILADTTGVTSFNTRTGAVSLTTADITGAGGATSASPQFTGIPQAPTATAGTNTTQLATTQFVQSAIASSGVSSFNARTGAVTLIANDISAAGGALSASPTFTGVPAAPTAAPGTNTTQLATTAYVLAAGFAPLASPTFTGTPSLPTGTTGVTQTAGTNNTTLATTAYVRTAVGAYVPLAGGVTVTGALTINSGGNDPLTVAGVAANNVRTLYVRPAQTWSCGQIADGTFGISDMTHTYVAMTIAAASGGTISFNGPVAAMTGRIISQSAGNNPSVTCFDSQMGAQGIFIGGSSYLYFALMNANGTINSQYAHFDTVGNLSINGTLAQGSDAALKANVADAADYGLDQIMALRPVRYTRLDQPDHVEVGFIAQEVEPVLPEAVTLNASPDDTPGILSLSFMPFIAAMVNGVKELVGQAATLRERIEALEARMAELGA